MTSTLQVNTFKQAEHRQAWKFVGNLALAASGVGLAVALRSKGPKRAGLLAPTAGLFMFGLFARTYVYDTVCPQAIVGGDIQALELLRKVRA